MYLSRAYVLGPGRMSRMRWLRHCRGMSQAQLAAAVHTSRQTIRSIELERSTPSVNLALAIARALGSTVEDLFAPS
jgi:DNA-binding XRE family transcriptional regulator